MHPAVTLYDFQVAYRDLHRHVSCNPPETTLCGDSESTTANCHASGFLRDCCTRGMYKTFEKSMILFLSASDLLEAVVREAESLHTGAL